jgi:hypothetical protein
MLAPFELGQLRKVAFVGTPSRRTGESVLESTAELIVDFETGIVKKKNKKIK